MHLEDPRPGGDERASPAGQAAEPTCDGVAYHVFVDRFANGDPRIDPANVAPWGSEPSSSVFMGGDLAGLRSRLDYLQGLGVTILCLTPIFAAATSHRYDTYDYYRIDPRVGTVDDLRRLVADAHRRGIRILLDGVFNHCGRGFFPFFDVMENGASSAWRDWFHITGFPVDAYGAHRFESCQGVPALPEFNLATPEARDYLLRVAAYWTGQGIDGWRLDAVPHVRYRGFWSELRAAVRRVNPAAYLLAEVWADAQAWMGTGSFDGLTNYDLRDRLIEYLIARSTSASEFARRLDCLVTRHAWPAPLGMWNLVGSHDTPRIFTVAGGDVAAIKLAFALQFFFPGIPAVYYGDEIGLQGGEDPDNRRAMVWGRDRWNLDLYQFVRRLARVRHRSSALQGGDWRTVMADDSRALCVFRRRTGSETALLVVNRSDNHQRVRLDAQHVGGVMRPRRLVDRLGGRESRVTSNGSVLVEVEQTAAALLLLETGYAGTARTTR